jgi:hypothetical protein
MTSLLRLLVISRARTVTWEVLSIACTKSIHLTLQLQIAVETNEVSQVAPQGGLALHGRHGDGLVTDDDRRPLISNDDMATDTPTQRIAAVSGRHASDGRLTRLAL